MSEDTKKTDDKKLAAIIIRSTVRAKTEIRDALEMLNLHRKYLCVILENTPGNLGMLKRVKDYIAWGEINDDVLKELIQKRSEKHPRQPEKMKKFFRLQPPKKGFERKGIKTSFSAGGALGYRGEKINDLIKRMI